MGFRGETRGQSEVVGAILIFGIIVAFMGINQAFLVPQANEDVEFQHSNDVQRDIVDLRSGIVEAAASNEPRSRSIALGMDYPTRFLAINPPSPAGTLRTVEGGNITSNARTSLSTVCGTGEEVPDTKFIQYQPSYNEYQNALPTNVESGVVYRRGTSSAIFSTGQILVQGNQINIVRIVGDVEKTDSGTVSVDLIPSETGRQVIETPPEGDNDNLNITVPSRLDASEWDNLLPSEATVTDNEGSVTIELGEPGDDNRYVVKCTTVGVNKAPNVEPTSVGPIDENLTNDPGGFNPLQHVQFVNATTGQHDQNETVTVHMYNNRNESVELNRTRILHYGPGGQGQSGGNPNNGGGQSKIPDLVGYEGTTLKIGGSAEVVNGPEIEYGETVALEHDFDSEDGDFQGHTEGAWYVMYLEFVGKETGERFGDTYFVPIQVE